MGKVIAIFNQAGGVGKTTLTMNLGYHVALNGHRVLMVDLDAQASLSVFTGFNPDKLTETIYTTLVDDSPLPIKNTEFLLDVVPANADLSSAEQHLKDEIVPQLRLDMVLTPWRDKYDYIFLDCPPSLGFLSISSLLSASHIIIPIHPQYKALMGTQQLIRTLSKVQKASKHSLKLAGVVPSIYDSRTTQERESLANIRESFAQTKVWEPIPRATDFANAAQANVPLKLYSGKHPALKVLDVIAKDLEQI